MDTNTDKKHADYNEYKIFNDSIHGHIEMHPLCVNIMDTVQFQRLRQIKQLGCCYYVYPGASHNRFEHSIGVSHLAGKLARRLLERQSDLNITQEDILCVEIAGLCHDLGHGPFSHVFDEIFMHEINPKRNWKHEEASVAMFDHLIKENKLEKKLKKHHLYEKDILFIKELIDGPQEGDVYKGRPDPKKRFLYDIVANKSNGIDVDKWDYFARDCYMLGIPNSFNYNRFMKFVKVLEVVEGEYHICLRDKEVGTLCDMLHSRNNIHRRACQNIVNKIVGIMISDALCLADPHYLIKGKDGKKMYKLSETINDMTAYTKMTDCIMYELLNTTAKSLKKSRDIITDVLERKFYKPIGEVSFPTEQKNEQEPTQQQQGSTKLEPRIEKMKTELFQIQEEQSTHSEQSDLSIHVVKVDYGMGRNQPILSVPFYAKNDEVKKVKESELPYQLPEKLSEQQVLVYCKSRDPKRVNNAKECFDKWSDNNKEIKTVKRERERSNSESEPQEKSWKLQHT